MANRERIAIEIWALDDTILHGAVPPEQRLLEEARYTIAGMLFGWSFRYVPASKARRIAQDFSLEARAKLPQGDPALVVRSVDRRQNILYGLVDYELPAAEERRQNAWLSVVTIRSAGVGTADLGDGLSGKFTAIEDAIRSAIDRYLRTAVANRPRAVHGEVILAEPPHIRPRAGQYQARVNVLMRITTLRRHLIH